MADSNLQDSAPPQNITTTQAAKLDAAVSSRLPTSSYTAPDNADVVAIKAKTDNLPASPAAQANLDVAVSTRLASASYTATDNASITAIKAKTDNLPATPASQADAQAGATVPTADSTANTGARDAIGNKTDAAVTTVGTTKTIMAYVKGILSWLTIPSADNTANASVADLLGNKTDAAVTTVGTNKTLMAYVKGLINRVTAAPTTSEVALVNFDGGVNGTYVTQTVVASTAAAVKSVRVRGSVAGNAVVTVQTTIKLLYGNTVIACAQVETVSSGTVTAFSIDSQVAAAAGTAIKLQATNDQPSTASTIFCGVTVEE